MGLEYEDAPRREAHEHDASPFRAYMRIFRYATPTEYTMQVVAIAAALASGVGMALVNLVFGRLITLITAYTTGASSDEAFRRDASRLSLYFFLIGLARFALTYGYSTLLTLAAFRITRNIRHEYIKAGLTQEVAFFDAGSGAAIATQALSNGRSIQTGISEKLGLVFQSGSTCISAVGLAFATQWKLTLICSWIAPATLLVMGVTAGLDASIETRVLKLQAQAGSWAHSMLGSPRTVHAFGLRPRLLRELDALLRQARQLGHRKSPVYGIMFAGEYAIAHAGFALCFWQGIRMRARGEVTDFGDIFTHNQKEITDMETDPMARVLMSMVIASTSLTSIAPFMIDFTRAASAAAELFQLIDRESEINPLSPSGERPAVVTGDIELQGVSFRYPLRPRAPVLDDISLQIPAGKVTALVGASGSGKSTIIALLERWYRPDSGRITLDHRPIDQLSLRWLRTHVRLVQQEPALFAGTVYDNIASGLIGTEWATCPKSEKLRFVQEAAEIAFAHDFISDLPDGYETMLGERGGMLSGGQRQRIAIARSIVSKPRILLLDEATSALDPTSEEVVQKALERVSQGRTTVTIAHKLATVRKADNIVVMEQGRIVEQGDHRTQLESRGAYARLVEAQDLSVTRSDAKTEAFDSTEDKTEGGLERPGSTAILSRQESASTKEKQDTSCTQDTSGNGKSRGLLPIVWRILSTTPELQLAFAVLMLGASSSAAIYPGQTILMSRFIEVSTYTAHEMQRKGGFLALMFLVIAIGSFVIYFTIGWSSNVVAPVINHKYRREIVSNMLRQDIEFFDHPDNTTGALASRADAYPRAVFELMGMAIALITAGSVAVLACSILALAYGWRLGLVIILAGLPPLYLSGWVRMQVEGRMENRIFRRFAQSSSIASEAVAAIRSVSSLAMEEVVLERYTRELDHATADARYPTLLMMAPFAFAQTVEHCFMALGFWYGCRLVSFGKLDMTGFFIAFLGVFFSGQQAANLFGFPSSITRGLTAANYILDMESQNPKVEETDRNRHTGPADFQSLDLADVEFAYPQRPDVPVLRGINLHIKRGQFVAFVGASGCGKSTMVAMLERFYDPDEGEIRVGPTALHTVNPWNYRREVALVQQEPTLFPGTIRQNILFGALDDDDDDTPAPASITSLPVADAEVEAACRAANAWDFVSSLPEGLSTHCGSHGLQLSGGQRQRLTIARALIRSPRLLLLDEATSALDTQSERVVQAALHHGPATTDGICPPERITIAVAHRLSTVRHADLICVFDRGQIVEAGTHEELMERGPLYRRMCAAQNLDPRQPHQLQGAVSSNGTLLSH